MDVRSALIGAAPFVAYWGAVTLCEVMAARAESDGEDTWEDLFWPRMLKRLDKNRHAKLTLRRAENEGHDGHEET